MTKGEMIRAGKARAVVSRLMKRMPDFMHPEGVPDRVANLDDLIYQIKVEIDMAESRSVYPDWTSYQFRVARAYLRDVIAAMLQQSEREFIRAFTENKYGELA